MINELKKIRANLEIEHAAQLRLLDSITARFDQIAAAAEKATSTAAEELASVPSAPSVARVQRPERNGKKTEHAPSDGSFTKRVIRALSDNNDVEFTSTWLRSVLPNDTTPKAVANTLQRLRLKGMLEPAGYGKWKKTANFGAAGAPSSKEVAYRALREGMHIKPPAEIGGAIGRAGQ